MNAGGVLNACKSYDFYGISFGKACKESGARVSNTWIIYLKDWDNISKGMLIPDKHTDRMFCVKSWPLLAS